MISDKKDIVTGKYYRYEGTSDKLAIPKDVSKLLGFTHLEKLSIELKTIDGKQGLFISKISKKSK